MWNVDCTAFIVFFPVGLFCWFGLVWLVLFGLVWLVWFGLGWFGLVGLVASVGKL